MRRVLLPLTVVALCALAEPALAAAPAEDADFKFLQDLAATQSWRLGRPSRVELTPDGTTVLFLRSPARSPTMRLFAVDVASGREREVITPTQVLGGAEQTLSPEEKAQRERMRVKTRGFTSYQLSRDGSLVLVQISGSAYVVPLAGGKATKVAGPDRNGTAIFDAHLSPDGKSVSFVRGGELWVAAVGGGPERRLTRGATALLTHAQAEFVAQEELARFTGSWWSPDSKSIVYEEADLGGVETFDFGDPAHPERAADATPYPRPGHPNARVAFEIIPAGGGKTVAVEWDKRRYEYVAAVLWEENAPLTLTLLTRDQKDLSLVAVDPATGTTRELVHEHDDAWVNAGGAYAWLRDGSAFLWASERGGAWQLELRDRSGSLRRTLTPPDFGFSGLVHVDLSRAAVIVGQAREPVEHQIVSIPLAGGDATPLTRGPASHTAVYARDSSAHVVFASSPAAPETIEIVRGDGSSAGALASEAEAPPLVPRPELRKVGPLGFWTATIRPHDFDPRRKYPVVVDVYGGPLSLTVTAAREAYVNDQWIADHGYVVVHADGRGTPGRGRDWERAIEKGFAEVPLADQVAALRSLGELDPALDLSRVGIVGHSFGGFMAALAAMRRPDVYKAAIAGAPVVDWLDYDTCYTERYLGVPPPAGASDAYTRNGLLPYAKDLAVPLLLIHGTADDNVHFQESLRLADALFKAGKRFDFLPQVGQTHQFYEPELMARYWQRIFAFWKEHLQLGQSRSSRSSARRSRQAPSLVRSQ